MKVALAALIDAPRNAGTIENNKEQANALPRYGSPGHGSAPRSGDKLEMMVDKELWPMPSYGDLIFEV